MRMRKRQFRIGELAQRLNIERFIIRFWEKEFTIKTNRSQGRQRYYDEEDLFYFQTIKKLLYQRGFTIAGARKELENLRSPSQLSRSMRAAAKGAKDSDATKISQKMKTQQKKYESQIEDLKKELLRLREML